MVLPPATVKIRSVEVFEVPPKRRCGRTSVGTDAGPLPACGSWD